MEEACMAFHEKSAWVMSCALVVGGVFYFGVVASISSEIGHLVPPILPLVAVYTAVLLAVAIAGHVVIALMAPKEAGAPLDERERELTVRASHQSGMVFGVGVILSLGFYLVSYDGNVLFYSVFGSLMVSQLAEYGLQILLYRTRV
jgi:hypothetical protein